MSPRTGVRMVINPPGFSWIRGSRGFGSVFCFWGIGKGKANARPVPGEYEKEKIGHLNERDGETIAFVAGIVEYNFHSADSQRP